MKNNFVFTPVFLILSVLLIFQTKAFANKDDISRGTLDGYIEEALRNSSQLKSAYETYTAKSNMSDQVTSLPDPKLTYGYFLSSAGRRTGPQREKIGVGQSFPWFGTLSLRGELVDSEAQAELYRFLSLKNELVFQITNTYTELAYVNSAIQITNGNMELVKSWEGVLQQRFKTTTGSHNDLVLVQIELGTLENKLIQLRDLKTPLRVKLNSLLNRESEEIVKTPERFLSEYLKGDDSILSFDKALIGNPELKMIDAIIVSRKSGVLLAEKTFYPDFTLGLDYVVTEDRELQGGGDDSILGMVTINVPIYWQKNRAAVREAKSHEKSIVEMRKDKELKLKSEFSKATYELRNSKRKVSLYRNTLVPKAKESIEASYAAYTTGDLGFLEVIVSEEKLLEFQLALLRAEADAIIASTKLRQFAGDYSDSKTSMEGN